MKVYRSFGSSSIGRFVLPLLLLQQHFEHALVAAKSAGPCYKTLPLTGGYELVCRKNEVLQCTVPCCEPTCDNDCSKAYCPAEIVRRKTCVCAPGYVRHKGKCIHRSKCPPKPPAPCECGPNEELLPSPPSCEPTCTDDCSSSVYHTRYVDQPTCVCRKGYRRHNGKCIRVDQCPTCGPYATLRPHAPCCEPTCRNDCSNVICISENYGEPACVCQDGYVKHNATCIRKETCPKYAPTYDAYPPETVTESPKSVCSYCNLPHVPASNDYPHSDHYGPHEIPHSARCDCRKCSCPHTVPTRKPTVHSVTYPSVQSTIAPYTVAPPTGCGCGRSPCPHFAQYAPPTGCGCGKNPCPHVAHPVPPTGCGCGKSPCPHVAQPAPPTGCGCGKSPCPHVAQPAPPTGCGCGIIPCPHSVASKHPVPYYQGAPVSTQKDQPYYSIPALKQCSCNIANQQNCYCPTPGLGHPIRPTVAPCEKQTPQPHYQESTYNKAKDPYIVPPYQLAPVHTVTTAPPTEAYTTTKYDLPYYQHNDQPVNVPYQYVPQQYQSTINEAHKDQCYLPIPATISHNPEPIDVAYIIPPSPPCFPHHSSSHHAKGDKKAALAVRL